MKFCSLKMNNDLLLVTIDITNPAGPLSFFPDPPPLPPPWAGDVPSPPKPAMSKASENGEVGPEERAAILCGSKRRQ